MRPRPKINREVLNRFRRFVLRFTKDWPEIQPLSFDDYIEALRQAGYSGGRIRELKEAYEQNRGYPPPYHIARRVKSFPKVEDYVDWKWPRWINSRTDRFKVFFGPYVRAAEAFVYQYPAFAKHLSKDVVVDRIIGMKRKQWQYYYETDFTAFEGHFVKEIKEACELIVYRRLFARNPHLSYICKVLTGKNELISQNVSAVVEALRMSGECDTSLSNGWTNYMLTAFLVSEKGGDFDIIVEGDDALIGCNVPLYPEDYAQLGFVIKMEPIGDPCKASFCGLKFCESRQIIRNPTRFVQKFCWTHSCIDGGQKVMNGLLRAKALSALHETPHCPIVWALAKQALNMTQGYKPIWRDFWVERIPREIIIPESAPTLETRMLFQEAYGIDVDAQIECENKILMGDLASITDYVSFPKAYWEFENRFEESREDVPRAQPVFRHGIRRIFSYLMPTA